MWPPHPAAAPKAAVDGDRAFLAAQDAFRLGERVRLSRLMDALRGHELAPWAEYWLLRLRLEEDAANGVRDFLVRHEGSYLAEKLRADWLKTLAVRQEWTVFQEEYPRLAQPDREVACHALQGRLVRQRDITALDEARFLWLSALDLPESCTPLMDRLIANGRLSDEDIWTRTRRLLEAGKLPAAREAISYLPSGERSDAHALDAVIAAPARHLARLPAHFADTRAGREMALFAVQRMARNDPLAAAAQWQTVETRFSDADRAHVWGRLAWQAAMQHLDEALDWYDKAEGSQLSDEQLAWRARAALRAGDWRAVDQAIARMPPPMGAQPGWTYWLARALVEQGRRDEAQALYRKIAGQPNFYGNLADDELGRPITVPSAAEPPSAEELAQAAANPGLQRALALFRLDMRVEGVREWSWALSGMDDRQLLAAAEWASRHDALDRAIHTADRTRVEHDYRLRYPAPFRESVEPKARELDLDHGWVYGLMRQESRFVANARSSAGAKGLMQIMPATANWVAKKIGLTGFRLASLGDTDTNVKLGTHYLKMVLESLDNHPVLAAAAYNAGPNRARKWRAARPLEGAIYAETIPFSETRDYVKKVMSNAVYYAALFEGKPQSLKSRLGVVRPKGGDAEAEYLP
ncbi:MAG: lytic transglycosylase domain-containing protein [Candidatus Nitricoxidivorans perseverans]|uniref:Lytic transglycosylase domain-containing protein n=1 Tax=Candidatus Nitricoxidivorans perseverans TaxID=2975601 RepID=A0AA49ISQ0_9PROT|nr:MAG: lytic transglycosylase domain-containing protein [Candidatus Nitricoxidivorans perseverans]